MKKSQISKAVSIALAGSALAFGAISTASAGTTMYNNFISGGGTAIAGGTCGTAEGTVGDACTGATDGWGPDWSNSMGSGAAYGYAGNGAMMWGAHLATSGDSVEISQQDSFDNYGIYADVDTAKGAWLDPLNEFGWKHDLEIGLLKSDVAQSVTLSAVGTTLAGDFGYTILKGIVPNTGFYNHHGEWNNTHDGTVLPTSQSNPFATPVSDYGTDIVDSTRQADAYGINTITFDAEAGQIYTILFGGYMNGDWGDSVNGGYVLDISTSPVPVPAAVWLFGSALAGLSVTGRRKLKKA